MKAAEHFGDKIYEDIIFLRKNGFEVYRDGRVHLVNGVKMNSLQLKKIAKNLRNAFSSKRNIYYGR